MCDSNARLVMIKTVARSEFAQHFWFTVVVSLVLVDNLNFAGFEDEHGVAVFSLTHDDIILGEGDVGQFIGEGVNLAVGQFGQNRHLSQRVASPRQLQHLHGSNLLFKRRFRH